MPFLIEVDERARVLHVHPIGEVSDADVLDLNNRMCQEAAYIEGYPILCDCSQTTAVLASAGLIEAIAKAGRSRKNLLAIIAPRAVVFGMARMYQIVSDPEDKRIHVFAKSREALEWLGTECATRDRSRQEQRTTVRKHGRAA